MEHSKETIKICSTKILCSVSHNSKSCPPELDTSHRWCSSWDQMSHERKSESKQENDSWSPPTKQKTSSRAQLPWMKCFKLRNPGELHPRDRVKWADSSFQAGIISPRVTGSHLIVQWQVHHFLNRRGIHLNNYCPSKNSRLLLKLWNFHRIAKISKIATDCQKAEICERSCRQTGLPDQWRQSNDPKILALLFTIEFQRRKMRMGWSPDQMRQKRDLHDHSKFDQNLPE
jgi:hypothetical protein